MIKFSADSNKLIGIALEKENINKLRQGMPIVVREKDMKELSGIPITLVIMYGDTQAIIEKKLSVFFTKDTKIIDKTKEGEK